MVSRSWFRKPEDKLAKESHRTQQKRKQSRCYVCDSPAHLARQCQRSKRESIGGKSAQAKTSKPTGPGSNVIRDNSCSNVRGESRSVVVNIEGIPITGDTILRGDMFYSLVSKSDLNVLDLKVAEQVNACSYNQKPICLDLIIIIILLYSVQHCLDDVIVFSETLQDHIEHLEVVFD